MSNNREKRVLFHCQSEPSPLQFEWQKSSWLVDFEVRSAWLHFKCFSIAAVTPEKNADIRLASENATLG
jgi:hypothetical protein